MSGGESTPELAKRRPGSHLPPAERRPYVMEMELDRINEILRDTPTDPDRVGDD